MTDPIVQASTSRGGVLRTHKCDQGVSIQCSAGRNHFDAFVTRDGEQWSNLVISQGVSALKADEKPQAIVMAITPDFADLLAGFFQGISKMCKTFADNTPEQQAKSAQIALAKSAVEVENLKGELKAVRSHKRKPRTPKAVVPA